jgi:hypothetical protein
VTLTAQTRLARVYYEAGQYRRAEDLYSSALAVRGRLIGFEDPLTLSSAFGLASVYMKSKAWASARPVLEVRMPPCRRSGAPERKAAANLRAGSPTG